MYYVSTSGFVSKIGDMNYMLRNNRILKSAISHIGYDWSIVSAFMRSGAKRIEPML